jgi:cyclophilin family peptidyl-prolyl cis-trans isomerase
MCKRIPNKKLHYLDTPVHRVQRDFVAQGGDITRGDGSGGDVRFVSNLIFDVCASLLTECTLSQYMEVNSMTRRMA